MNKDKLKIFILRTVGNTLLLTSILGVLLTFGPAVKEETIYRFNQLRGVRFVLANTNSKDNPPSFGGLLSAPQPQIITPADTDFGIVIPKINANSKVIPNVDPANYNEYITALKKGVAHARGTVFPGMKGNIYLFAHSTDNFWNVGRYNAVFYLLKELQAGDDIYVFFMGKRYNYVVYEKTIVNPDQVNFLYEQPKNDEILTLQTCYPPGTAWKRLIIRARLRSAK